MNKTSLYAPIKNLFKIFFSRIGNPFMMAELKGKLKKPAKE